MGLHVYHEGEADWYVAESVEEARRLYIEHNGYSDPGDIESIQETLDAFKQLRDDRKLTIWCDANGAPCESREDGSSRVTKTCAEWAANASKGLLCSTEY